LHHQGVHNQAELSRFPSTGRLVSIFPEWWFLAARIFIHQIARRTEGHLFISVLAYHLLICIETQLKDQGDTRKWSTICKELSTYQQSTVIMTDEEGKIHHIRGSCLQEPEHQDIFRKLKIKDSSNRIHRVMKKNSL
jgi:hypothetical protein